jgi:hypothetical protein
MRKTLSFQMFVLVTPGLFPGAAMADPYSASQSCEQKDYARSLALHREMAELGQVDLFAI